MPAAHHETLRPVTLSDFTGQGDVVRELGVILGAANARTEVPPHLLFSGPPGLGKTTLAGIVAAECGLPLSVTSAPLLEKPGDLVALLIGFTQPTVLFIDEIHRLTKVVEETLYTAMEDRRVDIVVGQGQTARAVPMPLEPFTLVGATTRSGDLGGPFRDRFGHVARLRPYDEAALTQIVIRSATLLDMDLDVEAAATIAARSRGTPRIANKLLRRVQDYADSCGVTTTLDTRTADEALSLFGVDSRGLDAGDRDVLRALCEDFAGGPVGLETLAAACGEAPATLSEVSEPYLMRLGFIVRTPRGRCATRGAYEHLGLAVPAHRLVDLDPGTPSLRPAVGMQGAPETGGLAAPSDHRGTVFAEQAGLPGV